MIALKEVNFDGKTVSSFNPSKEIKDFTSMVQGDLDIGDEILNRSYVELNDRSVLEDDDKGKLTFNAWVDENIDDPALAWQWRGTRSKARNKALTVHANITATMAIPSFLAQNDDDEEDRDFSEMMDDSVEWLINNSNYKTSYLMATMGMLVNPVTYMGIEWTEVMQKIKERTESGDLVSREIIDEELSGFNAPVYSAEQVLISNAYEQNIQRQKCVTPWKYVEYADAKAMFGDHENWKHVKTGVRSVYNAGDGQFYEIKDDSHPTMVRIETPMYRRDDTEVPFVGGIYMGDNENVEANPMRHRDNRNAPKIPIVPFGYQRITEHFFFFKSLMNSMYWDNNLLDAQYEMGMNTTFLVANAPIAVMGDDKIDGEIAFPSAVVAFKDKETKIQPILPNLNPRALFDAAKVTEESMEEGSISDTSSGQLPQASQKATSVAIANRASQIILQGTLKNLGASVLQVGSLMADIVINHISTAQLEEISGDNTKLKYKTLILKDKVVEGKQIDKILRFDETLLGKDMSPKQIKRAELKLLEESGFPDNTKHLYRINPLLFSRMKYLTRIEMEQMLSKNKEFRQALMSNIQAQYQENPFVDLESLTRKTLFSFLEGETEDVMKKSEQTLGNDLTNILGAKKPQNTQIGSQAINSTSNQALAGAGLA